MRTLQEQNRCEDKLSNVQVKKRKNPLNVFKNIFDTLSIQHQSDDRENN